MNLRHFGITISNVEESLSFYQDILGLEVVKEMDESGIHIDNFSGISGIKVKTIKLKDDSGSMIELLKYHSHPQEANHDLITRVGCSHFAMTVTDLDDVIEKIETAGYSVNCNPQFSPDGNVRLTFAKGPDGVLIELVEMLK